MPQSRRSPAPAAVCPASPHSARRRPKLVEGAGAERSERPPCLLETRACAVQGGLDHRAGRLMVDLPVGLGRLQLHDYAGEGVGQRIVELAGDPVPLAADSELLKGAGVMPKLQVRLLY